MKSLFKFFKYIIKLIIKTDKNSKIIRDTLKSKKMLFRKTQTKKDTKNILNSVFFDNFFTSNKNKK